MSALKSGLIGAAAVGGVIALLFASGTVAVRDTDDEDAAAEDGDAVADKDGGKAKRRRKRRRKGGRKGSRKGGKKDDLESLGYIASQRDARHEGKQGLTVDKKDKRAEGFVLFNYCGWGPGLKSASLKESYGDSILLSSEGKEVHRWHSESFGPQQHGRSITRMLPNGDVLINVADTGIARLSWEGETLWKLEDIFHHDIEPAPDGSLWALVERKLELPDSEIRKILDQGVQHISGDGEILSTLWLSDVFADSDLLKDKLERKRKRRARGDVFHLNSVRVIPKAGPDGLWKAGDLLISLRNFNTIAVIDPASGEIRWTWGPEELQHQHSPVVTSENAILVFDNGHRRQWSRVLEVAPATGEVSWEYKGTDTEPFYSDTRGIVQDLPGGNAFVVSSNSGRIFEVTREGEIVWEYWTPEKHGSKVVPIRGVHIDGPLAKTVEGLLGDTEAGTSEKTDGGDDKPTTDGADKAEGKAGEKAPAEGAGKDAKPAKPAKGKDAAKEQGAGKDAAKEQDAGKDAAKPSPAAAE